jgi:hypothetical protein
MTSSRARVNWMTGAAVALAFGGCAASSTSPAAHRSARADSKQVIVVAKEFMRAYLGKDARSYFPEHNETALPLEAEFVRRKKLWYVSFGNGLTCNVFTVNLDETATRGAMSHLQGGRILQAGDRYDWDSPPTLRTVPEFRAAVKNSKPKGAAAKRKAPASTP